MTLGVPDSAGVTAQQTADTVSAHYNDTAGTRRAIRELGDTLACVVVEPLPANIELNAAAPGFLEMLREETTRTGAILLFDEVMTGFRLARRAATNNCAALHPTPRRWAKSSAAASRSAPTAGRRAMMECVAPAGPVYRARVRSAATR